MNRDDLESFLQSATFRAERMESRFEETHISWIAFSKRYVFKIKKPVKLSFLDFSSLAQRKKYCERELALNQRFSKIYLDVLPVKRSNSGWALGDGAGEIEDYAVVMRRMSSAKRMDNMLLEDKVSHQSIDALAKEVASFHQRARVIKTPFNLQKQQALFNDIEGALDVLNNVLGEDWGEFLRNAVAWSNDLLRSHAVHIQKRIDKGYQKDVHGDLHAGNIFLYRTPVLFDCIEFNDEFRQIDLLYEVAFLCMEMDASGHDELSRHFLKGYSGHLSCIDTKEDRALFNYYRCLRANVRAKVKAIAAGEAGDKSAGIDVKPIRNYLSLMAKYMAVAENAF